MLEVLPQIASFFWQIIRQYWSVTLASSVLAGFFTLWIIDRIFGIFDILKK